jgi:hypothetical protein
MSEERTAYTFIPSDRRLPVTGAPKLHTVELSDQWVRVLNELQKLRNDNCAAVVILLQEMKIGSIIDFGVVRK